MTPGMIINCWCKCSAFHNTTAIVGAGVLGLPFAMKYLTWSGGVIVMCLSWVTSLYTLWQVGSLPPVVHSLQAHAHPSDPSS
jgi:Transmembrane amino acid transporter protein